MQLCFLSAKNVMRVAVALLLWQGVASAQTEGVDNRWYRKTSHIAFYFSNSSIDGDFVGTTYLTGGTDVCSVPEIDGGDGFGVAYGYRMENMGYEGGFYVTEHEATWLGVPLDVKHYSIKLAELRVYTSYRSRLQPFFSGELNIERTIVNDGSYDDITGEVDDETFYGVAWGLGGGARVYLTPGISVIGQVSRQFRKYSRIKGVADDEAVEIDKLGASGWNLRVGLALGFGGGK